MGVQLPRWVWVGAGLLACVAGMVNVVGYLSFEQQAVTHLTGTTTLLGEAVAKRDLHAISRLAGVALAFMAGAALSGMIVQDSTLKLGRRYGVALVLESLLLFAAIPLFRHGQLAGALLAAMACGLQNAMVTTDSGAVVRTTHLSGMFTDLGIGLGHLMRGLPLPPRRLTLSGLIISGFLAGGILGAWAFGVWRYHALLIPSALTGLTGVGYASYRHWILLRQRRNDAPHAD